MTVAQLSATRNIGGRRIAVPKVRTPIQITLTFSIVGEHFGVLRTAFAREQMKMHLPLFDALSAVPCLEAAVLCS
jgi:hypothetical protein